ncbi:MAG TPA: transporter [Fimbriimonadaceae bacterium]|nr:transporter [Fimbriimonadaceae bacterium]
MSAAASLLAVSSVIAGGAISAKHLNDEPLVTDRPDFTESSLVVPKGRTQLEMGYTYRDFDGDSLHQVPELLVRVGTGRGAELRLGLPSYGMAKVDDREISGFGDTYLGMKIQPGPLGNGDGFALIPGVVFPSGRGPLTSGQTDAELRVVWSRDLSEKQAIAAMAHGLWTRDERGERNGVFQQTVSYSQALNGRASAFYEYAGIFANLKAPTHILHGGVAVRLNQNEQWDIHLGLTFSGSDRNPFIGFGYAMRR